MRVIVRHLALEMASSICTEINAYKVHFYYFYIFSVICFVSSESLFYDSIGKILILLLMGMHRHLHIGFFFWVFWIFVWRGICDLHALACDPDFVEFNSFAMIWIQKICGNMHLANTAVYRGFFDNVSAVLR